MSALGRREEALAAAQEAVAIFAPFFLRLPAAHGQRMAVMASQYVELSESLGVEPDADLLAPVAEAFQKLQDSQEAPDTKS